ncbi:cold-regulated 413 inner membrane protein 2, chloroplastic isoform X1 [Mercurialis annua]|uniref:cold-regulated 413 inner membrane protein 2, chloroplastic isoform X1 n=2 Tax=Mercurialis annua TaxID=3986 RepID=UPI00215FAC8B|nr:cold-regulated 413 inner membrane protein 2, chloroplastic isoform X1 [Mercurialis annua]
MESLCVSSSTVCRFTLHSSNNKRQCKLSSCALPRFSSSLIASNPLVRISIDERKNYTMLPMKRRAFGAVCYAGSGLLAARNLQWISTISSAILMVSKGTAIHKSFLVPLLALQAPLTIISWIKGEYGIWTAFMALLVRLFFYIPGELELPFLALLLVIVAPYQVINLRGSQEGAIIALVISGYLAFQHFSRAGNLQKAFEQGSIVATLAIICVTIVSCLFLF